MGVRRDEWGLGNEAVDEFGKMYSISLLGLGSGRVKTIRLGLWHEFRSNRSVRSIFN
jgi:hypothetical protein